MFNKPCDVLIVGNGIVGLSIADELLRRSPELVVAVAWHHDRAGAATPASGAMLGCLGEITTRSLETAAGRAKFSLSLEARKQWVGRLNTLAITARESDENLPHIRGTHIVLNT